MPKPSEFLGEMMWGLLEKRARCCVAVICHYIPYHLSYFSFLIEGIASRNRLVKCQKVVTVHSEIIGMGETRGG
jgi:hypothetical protein